jgi:hypothetical protein
MPSNPDLLQSIQNKDSGFLRIVLEMWGTEPETDDINRGTSREVLLQKTSDLIDSQKLAKLVEALPLEARQALDDLQRNEGRLPWAMFTRRYGAVREMGAGKRDRERPHQKPASPAETLWYRLLAVRAFLDTPDGPQEFAYIPGDLLSLLPDPNRDRRVPPGRAASPSERAYTFPASDRVLDDACTLLAATRLGLTPESPEFTRSGWDYSRPGRSRPDALLALFVAAELVVPSTLMPLPDPTRHFLELPRGKALAFLARSWQHSPAFNELRLIPGLRFEGEWQNDPLRARYTLLELLSQVPRNTWWSLAAFIASVKHLQPDFQRPAGDYDSWFIRDQTSNEYLRGFEHWEAVDGVLVRSLICGPLHWLGILELAAPDEEAPPTAFRFSKWSEALLNGAPPEDLEVEDDSFLISSDARLRVPRLVPRPARYQVARFCAWEDADLESYSYRLTAASLKRARAQGLRIGHLLTLLRRYALTVPPSLSRALERWDEQGSEARLERVLVLRLRSPEIMQALRNSRAGRYLGDPLGPTAVIVKPGAGEKVLAALVEMGYMGEMEEGS